MNNKMRIDFMCVGAPKAATSTLFELVKDHPEIYVPSEKEAPFFNDDEEYQKGVEWYYKTFFRNSEDFKSIGVFTPQYMSGFKKNTAEVISDRIKKTFPDVKIVMLLRHPIKRSYSQYKMHQRYGYIKKSFEQTTQGFLSRSYSENHNYITQDTNMYILASEYGRIYEHYLKNFKKENILILFTEELRDNPEDVLLRLFNFISVNPNYKPNNVYLKTHQGGGKAKIRILTPGALQEMSFINYIWKRLIPSRIRKKIFMKITRWNIKPDNQELDVKSTMYKRLIKYFSKDIKKLEKLSGRRAPWEDWP